MYVLRYDLLGFNPCFAGFPFWTIHKLFVFSYKQLSFNPCFAGFPFWTQYAGIGGDIQDSFNPCFAGFPFWTLLTHL